MRSLLFLAVFSTSLFAASFFSLNESLDSLFTNRGVKMHDLELALPSNWKISQAISDHGTEILRFTNGTAQVNFYMRVQPIDLNQFTSASTAVLQPEMALRSNLGWRWIATKKTHKDSEVFVSAFATDYMNRAYYGYTSAADLATAQKTAAEFVGFFSPNVTRSLTGPDYKGKKYYLGWGAAEAGNPDEMQNEVKYDVTHTHDIFTKDIGGDYTGTAFLSYQDATQDNIQNYWNNLKTQITSDDMYLEYSSGHGSPQGLEVGFDYTAIRDTVMGFNAKETVIFTMACYSGNLVDAFNQEQSTWQNFQQQGKTLFVMASSQSDQESQTGPGTDPAEPNGPDGSAGSAFGFSVWKALIGQADGAVDGVKDGYIDLGEIAKYVVTETQSVTQNGQTPVFTGSYDAKTLMVKVPPQSWVDAMDKTAHLTNDQIMQRIRQLDAAMRL